MSGDRSSQRALRALLVATAALLAVACASVLTVAPTPVAADEPFVIDGRLSARHGSDAVTANFTWRHRSAEDELIVTTPLGQQVAELHGDAQRVEVRTADGRSDEAGDWSSLTMRALGFRLPIDGLSAWVRGAAAPGSAPTFEYDAAGRAVVLRQLGWEVVYTYPDDASRRPSRLQLRYPDLEVRIVVDRWQ